MNLVTLKGAVLSKYNSVSNFAKAVGWSRNKTQRIINGVQEPKPSEIKKISEVLEIPNQDMFMSIFFNSMSTKWTK